MKRFAKLIGQVVMKNLHFVENLHLQYLFNCEEGMSIYRHITGQINIRILEKFMLYRAFNCNEMFARTQNVSVIMFTENLYNGRTSPDLKYNKSNKLGFVW